MFECYYLLNKGSYVIGSVGLSVCLLRKGGQTPKEYYSDHMQSPD